MYLTSAQTKAIAKAYILAFTGGYGIRPYVLNKRNGMLKIVGGHSICSRYCDTLSYTKMVIHALTTQQKPRAEIDSAPTC